MDPISKAIAVESNAKSTKRLGGVTGKGFTPGKSGNPGGRPKRKIITEIYEEILSDPAKREKVKQQIIKTMTSKGMAGVLERRQAADRTEGPIPTELEVRGLRDLSDEEIDQRLKALENDNSGSGSEDRKTRTSARKSKTEAGT